MPVTKFIQIYMTSNKVVQQQNTSVVGRLRISRDIDMLIIARQTTVSPTTLQQLFDSFNRQTTDIRHKSHKTLLTSDILNI